MKSTLSKISVIALVAVSLVGCTQLTADINNLTAALSSPNANQAASNLRAGALAFVCNIASIAKLAGVIEVGIANGNIATINPNSGLAKTYDITNTVIVTSTAVCSSLQGSVGATATVTDVTNGVATATPVGATK
jgi:hypothetical protein